MKFLWVYSCSAMEELAVGIFLQLTIAISRAFSALTLLGNRKGVQYVQNLMCWWRWQCGGRESNLQYALITSSVP